MEGSEQIVYEALHFVQLGLDTVLGADTCVRGYEHSCRTKQVELMERLSHYKRQLFSQSRYYYYSNDFYPLHNPCNLYMASRRLHLCHHHYPTTTLLVFYMCS